MSSIWKSSEEPVEIRRPRPLLKEWVMVLLWTLANAVGVLFGMFMAAVFDSWFLGSIVMGLVIGWLEWLILTLQRVHRAWTMLLNTTIALGTWGAALPVLGTVDWGAGLAAGFLVGLLQWLTLRNKVESAAWWIVVNIAAWGLGMAGYRLASQPVSWVLGAAVLGVIAGLVTGVAMAWLVRRPIYEEVLEAPLKDY